MEKTMDACLGYFKKKKKKKKHVQMFSFLVFIVFTDLYSFPFLFLTKLGHSNDPFRCYRMTSYCIVS